MDFGYHEMDPGFTFSNDAGVIVAFYLIYWAVMMAVCIITYVLQSVGLYTMARRRGIRNAWLSWLPVGCAWILGSISDQYQYVVKGKIRNKRKALLVLHIILLLACAIVFTASVALAVQAVAFVQYSQIMMTMTVLILSCLVTMGITVAINVIQYVALYDLYRSAEVSDGVVYLVLSILISITQPIFIFLCRNKDGGMPPRIKGR